MTAQHLTEEVLPATYDSEYDQYIVISVKKPKSYAITYKGEYVRIKVLKLDNTCKWIPKVLTLNSCTEYVNKLNKLYCTDEFKCEEL